MPALYDVLSLSLILFLVEGSELSVWVRRLTIAILVCLCIASYPDTRDMFIGAYDNTLSILKTIQR